MAIHPGRVVPAASPQGPPSEREFIDALRRLALLRVDVEGTADVLGLTPVELEEECQLSRPSVSGLIRRFEPILQAQDCDGNALDASDQARRWALKAKAGVAIGVAIDQYRSSIVLCDLYGRIEAESPVDTRTSADETVDAVVSRIRDLLGTRTEDDVVGVGISLAAPVEPLKGVNRAFHAAYNGHASPWADWQLMMVRNHFRARLGWDNVPLVLDNDANAGALAEYTWGAARPSRIADGIVYRNVIYVEWSRGIGAGIILDGQLYRGQGVAGELGHTVAIDDDEAQDCPRCGNRGCLETVAGWEAVLQGLPASTHTRPLSDADLLSAFDRAGDPKTDEAKAFRRAAWEVGRALGPLIHFLNPQLVIVGGDVGTSGYNVIRTTLLESLRRYTMRPALVEVTVLPGRLGRHAALRGATALVLHKSANRADPLLEHLQRCARVS